MKAISIAADVSLPLDVVTQTLAAIGRKGAGKTYLASLLAEQMLDAEAQVIAIDPVGNWWGLRVASDGHSKGKDIFVIGGEHGDVPLVPEAGARIAHLVVEKRISAVLDISSFRQGERKRFAAEFAEEFFHLKKQQRSAVHLFIEEAQLFAPQRCGPDEARMLGAFENIVRLGRNYGIGATLVTQRPQSVNKEVLSQVECLCVLQVNGTHERKALEDWVQEAGADRKLVGELPGLGRGEGFIWSPSWLRIYQRVHFNKKVTFDASATPEVGKAAKAAKLSAVDVEALRESLKEVVAQAEKDDPKALRKQIAELERAARNVKVPILTAEPKIEIVKTPALNKEEMAKIERVVFAVETHAAAIISSQKMLNEKLELLRKVIAESNKIPPIKFKAPEKTQSVRAADFRRSYQLEQPVQYRNPDNGGGKDLRARVLRALAEWEAIGRKQIKRVALSGLVKARGGYFENTVGSMKTDGLVHYPEPGYVALTEDGRNHAPKISTAIDTEEMISRVRETLSGLEVRVFDALVNEYPSDMMRSELSEKVDARGGYFENTVGSMKTRELLTYPQKGQVRLAEWIFLD